VQSRPEAAADIERIGEVIRDDPAVCAAWQQLTGPVMAKGAEDRAFYRYLRMASMCEVGGAPGVFTLDAEVFHRHQGRVQAGWPVTMLACNTHDTKRSDGVRARSLALAERAASWVEVVRGWFDANGDEFAAAGLDPAIMLLALQTAVSAAPISAQRLGDYLLKSAREADLHTAWTEPDDRYESALASLAEFVVADTGDRLMPFASELMRPGWRNALTEITLQLTCPGVPDLYQGSLVDLLTLVDPDNRLTPDWARLRTILDEAAGLDVATAWIDRPRVARGVVIGRVLGLRRRRPEAFGRAATYAPLPAGGVGAHHVVAYARGDAAGSQVVVVVELRSVSDDTRNATTVDLPTGRWRPLLVDDAPIVDGGAPVSLGVLAAGSPVVVLEREDSASHPS